MHDYARLTPCIMLGSACLRVHFGHLQYLQRQSSMLRCWFRIHRLPDSFPSVSTLRDSRSQAYITRPSLLKPFGLRVANPMAELSVDPTPVYSFRLPQVGYWQLPVTSLCPPAMDGKKDFLPVLSHTRFLEHSFMHSDEIPVFTDGSKSDAGVGFSVAFPSFYRCGSLPSMASVFTAVLSAIVLALQIIFTLPVSSYMILVTVLISLSCPI
ncbi:hypothetical protein E2C01_084806 [Portunus trituberculatus]|uniref:Uncharacterized protein n=1 Tax=Portunus trituberculatus TaxID=210409 RepID=A0A5B7J501_PORTR|nr:hypothetical protein [Portunus trituberculatus]